MDDATRALVRISAAIGRQDRAALEQALDTATTAVPPLEVEEALLQSHLFAGYPAMIQAFALWRQRCGTVASGPAAERDDPLEWERRGEDVCARVYGGQYHRLRENVARLHPALDRWMVVDGYGRVLGRPGLDLAKRELCIVALLCAQDAPQQLYSHLRGALNAGATRSAVEAALQQGLDGLPAERAEAALRTWRAVSDRSGGERSPDRA